VTSLRWYPTSCWYHRIALVESLEKSCWISPVLQSKHPISQLTFSKEKSTPDIPRYVYIYRHIHTCIHTITYHTITLHYITYHCIPLHTITLHYIHMYIYIYVYIYIHIDIDIDIPKYRSGYPMISPDMTRYDNDMPLFPPRTCRPEILSAFCSAPSESLMLGFHGDFMRKSWGNSWDIHCKFT